ncbi:MAG: CocE/NonD family hydrolase [Pseudomonadota bacterium]
MKIEKDLPRTVIEYPDMGIVMSDGTRLSARAWMPDDAETAPVPVILEHLPYRKRDGTIVRDQFSHPWMAGHGYCCIRTDMRGSGDSEGLMDDEYTHQELQDACEVIAWAAAQPWCNGNVGMQGISWGGFNSLQVAALQPPALKAIITICSTVDRYADDIHYKGGCLLLENFGWSANMLSYSSRPPDPELVGEEWPEIWRHRLENQSLLWSDWLRHQHRDAYWEHGSVCEDYSAISAAVLTVGGWHDGYRNTISHLVANLDAPVKGIVGPWNHKYPHYAGPKPAIGFLQESKRWWDHWLKGEDTGVESDPAYRAYMMDSLPPQRWYNHRPGRWIAEENWPSDQVKSQTLHLGSNTLSAESVDCGLSISSPQDCGSAAGEYFPFAFGDELPAEQSIDDAMSLCFLAQPNPADLEILGSPRIRFVLSSDKSNAHVTVRLCDVQPDGSSALITHGVLNLTHQSSHAAPEPLVSDREYTIEFDLDQIAYRMPKGHRLQLAVSSSNWPMLWPSPENVTITVHSGSVSVPLRDASLQARGDEWSFEPPVGAPHWRCEALREASYERFTETDEATGVVTTRIKSDSGENKDLQHGLVSGSWFDEIFEIHPDDPLSACANSKWEQTGGRDGKLWRTCAEAEMTSDESHFHTKASLRAYINGVLFFERDYLDSVPRQLV